MFAYTVPRFAYVFLEDQNQVFLSFKNIVEKINREEREIGISEKYFVGIYF